MQLMTKIMANVNFQVSRGAECIMISKKFFTEHANALTKRWLRLNVSIMHGPIFHVYAIFTTKENDLSVTSLQKAYRFLLFYKPITPFSSFRQVLVFSSQPRAHIDKSSRNSIIFSCKFVLLS